MDDFIFARMGAQTKRYHTNNMLQHQTVGEHSFQVAMICAWLAKQQPPGVGVPLLMAALCHDLAEQRFGDMPAPAKRAMPDVGAITFRAHFGELERLALAGHELDWEFLCTEQELHWLKVADAADGCLHCIQERAMGNMLIRETWANFERYLTELVDTANEGEMKLYAHIQKEWRKYDGPQSSVTSPSVGDDVVFTCTGE